MPEQQETYSLTSRINSDHRQEEISLLQLQQSDSKPLAVALKSIHPTKEKLL
jgi:hypothetical protein